MAALSLSSTPSLAVEEPFCDEPEICTEDRFALRFWVTGSSELTGARPGDEFELEFILDVKSTGVVGLSYSVVHDPAFLTLLGAGLMEADPVIMASDIKIVRFMNEVGRFFVVIVVNNDDVPPFELPVRDGIRLATARYRIISEPPAQGTRIFLDPDGNPRARVVENAVVRGPLPAGCAEPAFAFYFGPQASREQVDLGSALEATVSLRNQRPLSGFRLGIFQTGDRLFFRSLGESPVDLAVWADGLAESTGDALKGNSARGAPRERPIVSVAKGPALAPFTTDFLSFQEVPGRGVTVSYTADPGGAAIIPAVGDAGGACGSQEILKVVFRAWAGDLQFARGDANGDGRLTITDLVLIVRYLFGGRASLFDCNDAHDVNDDAALDVSDPVVLALYLFQRGPAPPPPFLSCGADPRFDGLECRQSNCR